MFSEMKERRVRRPVRILAVMLCLVLAVGLFAGTAFAEERQELSAADIYEQNVGSTVGITTTVTTNIWGYETRGAASGSGFIVSDDGYILTNYHVVQDAESITVTTYSDDSYDAELIGYDESSDIAVLKIDAQDLDPVTIGDSGALRVGDEVLAIGNPLGELTFSLTGGMISALDREVTVSNGVTMDLIQTDCAINAGNSGGALFNMYGEVIGITNAKYSGSGSGSQASIDNIGFAIPISRVFYIVESIMTDGVISKPYIGVTVKNMSTDALDYGLPKGVSVESVAEDSPAEKAGLQNKDIITAMDDTATDSVQTLKNAIAACAVGSEHTLTVYRQGETLELTIEIGEDVQPALPSPAPEQTQTQTAPQDWENFPFDSFEDFIEGFGGGRAS